MPFPIPPLAANRVHRASSAASKPIPHRGYRFARRYGEECKRTKDECKHLEREAERHNSRFAVDVRLFALTSWSLSLSLFGSPLRIKARTAVQTAQERCNRSGTGDGQTARTGRGGGRETRRYLSQRNTRNRFFFRGYCHTRANTLSLGVGRSRPLLDVQRQPFLHPACCKYRAADQHLFGLSDKN